MSRISDFTARNEALRVTLSYVSNISCSIMIVLEKIGHVGIYLKLKQKGGDTE